MANYNTRQRDLLLSYLSGHADEQLSVQKIISDLKAQKISASAVYRKLADLEQKKQIKRCTRENSRESFYQYINLPECKYSLHLSCRVCGKMFHMEQDEADRLIDSIAQKQGFLINRAETVLYGICRDCAESLSRDKNT